LKQYFLLCLKEINIILKTIKYYALFCLEVFYLSISHSIKVEEAKALKAFKALKDLFSSKALFDFFFNFKK
jgi:hypothetical protein